MNYYAAKEISLSDVEEHAKALNYRTGWVSFSGDKSISKPRLSIHFGLGKREWWQYYQMDVEELSFDSEDDRQVVKDLQPRNIFLFEYYSSSLPVIVKFVKPLLYKYGGWMDCRGDSQSLYTKENIEDILNNCP